MSCWSQRRGAKRFFFSLLPLNPFWLPLAGHSAVPYPLTALREVVRYPQHTPKVPLALARPTQATPDHPRYGCVTQLAPAEVRCGTGAMPLSCFVLVHPLQHPTEPPIAIALPSTPIPSSLLFFGATFGSGSTCFAFSPGYPLRFSHTHLFLSSFPLHPLFHPQPLFLFFLSLYPSCLFFHVDTESAVFLPFRRIRQSPFDERDCYSSLFVDSPGFGPFA